jgi:hypothetical protein
VAILRIILETGDCGGSDVEVSLHLLFRHDQCGDKSRYLINIDILVTQKSNAKSTGTSNTCVCLRLVARQGVVEASYIWLRAESKRRRRSSINEVEAGCKL